MTPEEIGINLVGQITGVYMETEGSRAIARAIRAAMRSAYQDARQCALICQDDTAADMIEERMNEALE